MTYEVYLEPRSAFPLVQRSYVSSWLEAWTIMCWKIGWQKAARLSTPEALSKLQSNLFWNLKIQARNEGIWARRY